MRKVKEMTFFKAGVEWPNEQEYIKIVRMEIKKLDKKDYDYNRKLEAVRAFYGVRKIDTPKFLG